MFISISWPVSSFERTQVPDRSVPLPQSVPTSVAFGSYSAPCSRSEVVGETASSSSSLVPRIRLRFEVAEVLPGVIERPVRVVVGLITLGPPASPEHHVVVDHLVARHIHVVGAPLRPRTVDLRAGRLDHDGVRGQHRPEIAPWGVPELLHRRIGNLAEGPPLGLVHATTPHDLVAVLVHPGVAPDRVGTRGGVVARDGGSFRSWLRRGRLTAPLQEDRGELLRLLVHTAAAVGHMAALGVGRYTGRRG